METKKKSAKNFFILLIGIFVLLIFASSVRAADLTSAGCADTYTYSDSGASVNYASTLPTCNCAGRCSTEFSTTTDVGTNCYDPYFNPSAGLMEKYNKISVRSPAYCRFSEAADLTITGGILPWTYTILKKGYTYLYIGSPSGALTPRCSSCDSNPSSRECNTPSFTTSTDLTATCYDQYATSSFVQKSARYDKQPFLNYFIPLKTPLEWEKVLDFFKSAFPGRVTDSCTTAGGSYDATSNSCKILGSTCPNTGWALTGATATSAESCTGRNSDCCTYVPDNSCTSGHHNWDGVTGGVETCGYNKGRCEGTAQIACGTSAQTCTANLIAVGCKFIPSCGTGGCQADKGETTATCLVDCPACVPLVCGPNDYNYVPDGCGGTNYCGTPVCLLYDSLIMMSDGTEKVIQNVEIGEFVKGMDKNGKVVDTKVIDALRNHPREGYYLINGGLKITNDHPVAVLGGNSIEWIKTEDLKIGDKIKSATGVVEVRTKEYISTPEITAVLQTEAGNFITKGADGETYLVKGGTLTEGYA